MRSLRIILIGLFLCACETMSHGAPAASSGISFQMNSTSHYVHHGATQESATPQMMVSSIPIAARNVTGGMTADQTMRSFSPRKAIIHDDDDDGYGDDDLRPGYDPNDPFATPLTDTPWSLMALLALCYLTFILFRATSRTRALHSVVQ